MLKQTTLELAGRDTGNVCKLTELPALVADRLARAILRQIGADLDGGVVALALRHINEVRALGEPGLRMLQQFVVTDEPAPREWRNIERIQQAALALHVGFIVDRAPLDIPVSMRADQILHATPDTQVTFCSPHIAAVLDAGKATYREMETVLSTEDAYNIVEILNVRAVHDWHAHKT